MVDCSVRESEVKHIDTQNQNSLGDIPKGLFDNSVLLLFLSLSSAEPCFIALRLKGPAGHGSREEPIAEQRSGDGQWPMRQGGVTVS